MGLRWLPVYGLVSSIPAPHVVSWCSWVSEWMQTVGIWSHTVNDVTRLVSSCVTGFRCFSLGCKVVGDHLPVSSAEVELHMYFEKCLYVLSLWHAKNLFISLAVGTRNVFLYLEPLAREKFIYILSHWHTKNIFIYWAVGTQWMSLYL